MASAILDLGALMTTPQITPDLRWQVAPQWNELEYR